MSRSIAATAIVHDGVRLAAEGTVEEFCIVGASPRDVDPGELETVIASGFHLRSHTVVYAGNRIGRHFQTGNKANIRESNTIGDDVSIGSLAAVEHHVRIGNGVRIHGGAFVPEFSILEDGCWIGPGAVLTNAKYPLAPGAKERLQGPRIEAGAIIGANATILPGVAVGRGAIVGAGSVVVRDVEPFSVWAGNPARRIKDRHDLPYGDEKP